jgi:hypothetical protein
MTEICELSDIELDAVCGGSLFSGPVVSFGAPLVSITNSFNPITVMQTNVQTGLIVGLGSIAQDAGNAVSAILGKI